MKGCSFDKSWRKCITSWQNLFPEVFWFEKSHFRWNLIWIVIIIIITNCCTICVGTQFFLGRIRDVITDYILNSIWPIYNLDFCQYWIKLDIAFVKPLPWPIFQLICKIETITKKIYNSNDTLSNYLVIALFAPL